MDVLLGDGALTGSQKRFRFLLHFNWNLDPAGFQPRNIRGFQDFRVLLRALREDLVYLDDRIKTEDKAILQAASSRDDTQRLQQLRGVGPVIATALVAALGDGKYDNIYWPASGVVTDRTNVPRNNKDSYLVP